MALSLIDFPSNAFGTVGLLGAELIVSSAQNTNVSLVMSSKERKGFLVIDLEPRPLSAPRPVRPVEGH